MISRIFLFLAAAGLLAGSAQAEVQRHGRDQDMAYEARKLGKILPLREIEARVLPRVRGADYLGPELDAERGVYRLKFMKDGRVLWIDVDAASGQILGRSN
ncbi:PepSY domain-containing protein [Allosphingosinicella flava]|uniref:PepSY domain-containing protein n=1 Tax=Allosphingosinicella flava TaxID=2771430 RepID=A0A7T2LLR5_9SPHN|nr:PepSY domain-containing protein [Sphingosinicella flava]QPQ54790.1 PepSY domain-containing protein [Sphingosinicella flava]